ncbi:hypothetical protein Cgig2_012198 [Carnegiea gigantea]|uniref:Uncharacterized protein n=1 Tax=Carnegiea gigantea TaxID=171969 RepID=A0A9Q1KTE3_9CARY|nr:hypothetical protein Cgig2_012198 [Carnegiea gigantea]
MTWHSSAYLVLTCQPIFKSKDFYCHRRRLTCFYAYLVQTRFKPAMPKPTGPSDLGLSIFELETGSWDRVDSISGWKKGKDMPSKQSFLAIGGLNGRVYVAGRHDPDQNGFNSAWEYDPVKDEWTELTQMSEPRDEYQGLVIGSKFWIISVHDTESQGDFKTNVEFYDVDLAKWTRVEDAWVLGRSPWCCAAVGRNRELVSWSELNSEV